MPPQTGPRGRKPRWSSASNARTKTLDDTRRIVGNRFEKADKLKELLVRQAEIDKQLQAKDGEGQPAGDLDSDEEGLADAAAEGTPVASATESGNETVPAAKPTSGPISAFTPSKAKLRRSWLIGQVGDETVSTDRSYMVAARMEPASHEPAPDLVSIWKGSGREVPVKPVAFSFHSLKAGGSIGTPVVWLSDKTAIDAAYYSHAVRRFPGASFERQPGAGKPVYVNNSDGKRVAVIAPMGVTPPAEVQQYFGKPSVVLGSGLGSLQSAYERVEPQLTDLLAYFKDQFGPKADEARDNYSGMGALKTVVVRNLSQLEKASPVAHTAAVKAAASRSQAAALRGAMTLMSKALAGSDFSAQEVRLALIESRLQGTRDRWKDFNQQVAGLDDEALDGAFTGYLSGLLEKVEGKKDIPQNLAQTAGALIEAGDFDRAREFLAEAFDNAASRVTRVLEPEEFDAIVADPKVKEALGIYGHLVAQALAVAFKNYCKIPYTRAIRHGIRSGRPKIVSRNAPDGRTREYARLLLRNEGGSGDLAGSADVSLFRVLEALRRSLSTLVGISGFSVLLARAVALARTENPRLNLVEVKPDGSIEGVVGISTDEMERAGLVLVAYLLGLLIAFIGENLLLQILVDVWPDLAIPPNGSSGESET